MLSGEQCTTGTGVVLDMLNLHACVLEEIKNVPWFNSAVSTEENYTPQVVSEM